MQLRNVLRIPLFAALIAAVTVAYTHAQEQSEQQRSDRESTQQQQTAQQPQQRQQARQEARQQQRQQQEDLAIEERPTEMTEAFRKDYEVTRQLQQQRQQRQEQARQQLEQNWSELAQQLDQEFSYVYPSGSMEDGLLGVRVRSVASTTMGGTYPYEITVENVSDAPLAGVTVIQEAGQNLDFVAASVQPEQGADNQQRWVIGALEPGQSETIRATAVPLSQGTQGVCLAFLYEPALCTTVDVVQPNIELSKQVPDQAYVCEPLQVRYVVTNKGSGTAENVTITDPLNRGLMTADGEDQVQIDAGSIPAGESREFTVDLAATTTGEFASRATAKSRADQAQSDETPIRIIASDLRVSAQGPEWQYQGEPITYTIRVENVGQAVAQDATLALMAGEDAREPRDLGDIEPGQSKTVNVTIDPSGQEQVSLSAKATALCAVSEAQDEISTEIRAIPALLLETVDEVDPVRVGENTVYTIKVKNQGSAAAKNVMVTAKLPKELQFIEVSGDTEATQSGQNIEFQTIDELQPGDVVAWRLEAKAGSAADVRLETTLDSDFLDSPVPDVESTRLY